MLARMKAPRGLRETCTKASRFPLQLPRDQPHHFNGLTSHFTGSNFYQAFWQGIMVSIRSQEILFDTLSYQVLVQSFKLGSNESTHVQTFTICMLARARFPIRVLSRSLKPL